MAANRFATMLHRNTNKITMILIYAVLEWILIVLLLLNSLFSHLIIKFAEYFGLKPPCPWCTRVDHLFDPAKGDRNMNREFLCELHSKEISKLGFCSIHQKLIDSQDMCEDCLLSRPEIERNSGLFGKIRELGDFLSVKEKVDENGEVSLNCSCCGVGLVNNNNKDKYSSYVLLKTSSSDDVLEYAQKENLIPESGDFVSDFAADKNVLENKSGSQMISEFDGDLGNADKITEENGFISVTVNELRELEIGANEILKDETSNSIMKDKSVQVCVEEDKSLENSNQHLEFFLDYSGHKLVPIELIDLVTEENENAKIEEGNLTKDREICVVSEVRAEDAVVFESKSRNTSFLDVDINEEAKFEMLESMEIEKNANSLFFHAKGSYLETDEFEHFGVFPLAQWPLEETSNVQELAGAEMENHSDVQIDNVACEGASQGNNENEADVSIGTEIPDLDIQELVGVEMENHLDVQTDNVACKEASQGNYENEADVSIGTQIPDLDVNNEIQIENADHSYAAVHEEPLTNSTNIYADNDHGSTQVEEQTVEKQSVSIQDSENMPNSRPTFQMELNETEEDKFLDTPTSVNDEQTLEKLSVPIQDSEHTPNNQPTFQMELNETEEDKFPDTPTSVDLDKKLLLLEKRDSWTEGSIDGSVTSELDGGDGVVTIERLKTALRSERKALQALYTELEEERSASAVATNQTMAMINRLQEEKAAMQMEALQYQRMMEEQSEYDQEALQLLNELMVKREKEKQEMERELEVYRKKLSDYETREKIRALKKSRDGSVKSGFSSPSCSNAEDSDGLSIDLNQDAKEDEGVFRISEFSNQNTPVDAVVNLEESLADFEEERLSILEQLKVLEEKLVTLDDENEEIFEDVNGSEDLHENGHLNGYSNGKHYIHIRIAGQKGKSLLPLFDAISDENEDGAMVNGNGFDHDSCESKFEMENKKDAIEEEVDHLYERLQALEADQEFLKHCMSSLKKGDKGMDLLQEILQHLRDLRNVELRARNFGDGAVN